MNSSISMASLAAKPEAPSSRNAETKEVSAVFGRLLCLFGFHERKGCYCARCVKNLHRGQMLRTYEEVQEEACGVEINNDTAYTYRKYLVTEYLCNICGQKYTRQFRLD